MYYYIVLARVTPRVTNNFVYDIFRYGSVSFGFASDWV